MIRTRDHYAAIANCCSYPDKTYFCKNVYLWEPEHLRPSIVGPSCGRYWVHSTGISSQLDLCYTYIQWAQSCSRYAWKNTVVRTSERARVCSTNFQYYLFTRCHTALRRCVQILYPYATSNRILYNVMGSSSVCIQTDLRYRVTDVQYYYRVYDTQFVVSRVIVQRKQSDCSCFTSHTVQQKTNACI